MERVTGSEVAPDAGLEVEGCCSDEPAASNISTSFAASFLDCVSSGPSCADAPAAALEGCRRGWTFGFGGIIAQSVVVMVVNLKTSN